MYFRVVQFFERFVATYVNPAFGHSADKAVLYLQHLKVMLAELGEGNLGLLRDAQWPFQVI